MKYNYKNFLTDLTKQIIISLLSACIFWYFFSYLPESGRKNEIRNNINYSLYKLYNNISYILFTIVGDNDNPRLHYQFEIRSKSLTIEDFKLLIQDKAHNDTYLIDNKINKYLIPINEKILKYYEEIETISDRLLILNHYLTTNEINIIENIRSNINFYDKNRFIQPIKFFNHNNKIYHSYANSMSNEYIKFYELYEYYKLLSNLLVKEKIYSKEFAYEMLIDSFYSKNYDLCIYLADKYHSIEKTDFSIYKILSFYMKGEKKYATKELENYLNKNKLELIPSRYLFKDIIHDKDIKNILTKRYGEKIFNEAIDFIQKDNEEKISYISNLKFITKYIDEKKTRSIAKATN